MDDLLLAALLAELGPRLVGARIEKAVQYGESDLALRVWLKPERATLLLSADVQAPAFAILEDEPAEPRTRSPLLESVRSHVVPSRITALRKDPHDRVLHVSLATGPPGSGAPGFELLLELFPRAPLLLLLDGQGRILAGAGRGLPGKRGLGTGKTYRAPDPPPPAAIPALGGLSRPYSREIEFRAAALQGGLPAGREALDREARERPRPRLYTLEEGRRIASPVELLHLAREPREFPSFAALARAWYEEAVAGRRGESLRARLSQALAARDARLAAIEERVAAESERAGSVEQDRSRGELLLAYQKTAELLDAAVRVPHPEQAGETLLIPLLAPDQDLVANARLYFDSYRNKQRTLAAVRTRRAALALERRHLADLDVAVATAAPGDLDGLQRELRAEGLLRGADPAPPGNAPRRRATPQALEPRRFRSRAGGEILVGRSSRGNDHLSFRIAQPDDFWLHAEGPGSHVVLRNPRRLAEPEPADLLEAAALAAWYSRLRGAAKAEVHWTRVKDLRRVPGGPPGMVTLRQHRAVLGDPSLAEGLFAAAARSDPAC